MPLAACQGPPEKHKRQSAWRCIRTTCGTEMLLNAGLGLVSVGSEKKACGMERGPSPVSFSVGLQTSVYSRPSTMRLEMLCSRFLH